MNSIIIFQLILIIIFIVFIFVLLFYLKRIFTKPQTKMVTAKKKDVEESLYFGFNQRETFRIPLNEKDCLVKLIAFENNNLNKLKNKWFIGYLENISIGGLKLICSYDLPAKQHISIETKFSLKGHEFSLTGQIIRKEEHTHRDFVTYGIQFTNVSDETQKLLTTVLNQIVVEKRRMTS